MKGLLSRLQAIESKVDKLLKILDGLDEEMVPTAPPPHPGNRCYHWQPADDKVLERMFKEGASDTDIANALHRTPNGVMNRRNKMGDMSRRVKT